MWAEPSQQASALAQFITSHLSAAQMAFYMVALATWSPLEIENVSSLLWIQWGSRWQFPAVCGTKVGRWGQSPLGMWHLGQLLGGWVG